MTLNWQTVIGDQYLPRNGDRIWHKDVIKGEPVDRVGVVCKDNGELWIYPAYDNMSRDYMRPRRVTDGLVWALSERKEIND